MTESNELSKNYEPRTIQAQIDTLWADNRAFHAEPTDAGEPYCIVIPPPNVTAALHLGHALNNTLQDILIRVHRMRGENAVWIPGTDHAGIATQTVVEKRVMKEEGRKRVDFPREEFVAKIQSWKDEYEQTILGQLRAMGCSCDFERAAFTMDEPRARAVREAFFQLFKDGLIYRGKRLVNWDPATQTALADDEVEMEEVDGFFYYLKYPLEDGSGTVTVATTRPETMLGDTAVALNPRDPRAAALRGKNVRLPIVNRVIPIVEDDYVVMPDPNGDDPKAKFATGFLKVTPAHDQNDYELGQRHKLDIINVLAPDGSISDRHGWSDKGDADFVIGLDRFEAREAIVEWFRTNKLLEDVKPYRHSVGHSYRSHVAIEPYLSDQWYCKVTDDRLRGAALRAIADDQRDASSPSPSGRGQGAGGLDSGNGSTTDTPSPQPSPGGRGSAESLRFYPARYAKTFQSWHENIRDWCISRQLWWGHRIPVWTAILADDVGGRAEDLSANGTPSPRLTETVSTFTKFFEEAGVLDDVAIRPERDEIQTAVNLSVRSARGEAAIDLINSCYARTPKHTGYSAEAVSLGTEVAGLIESPYKQDPDVLDTWFSSALWPMSTLGWPMVTEATTPLSTQHSALSTSPSALSVWNPTAVLSTAREIITLWVSRMVMFNSYFLNRLPFHHVFIHAMIQDGDGRKMSKSLGNGVDPLDIISSHGCDAMRFTLTSMATNTQDVRVPVERDASTGKNTSPKFDLGRNFCNKLWNAARFVLMQLQQSQIANRKSQIDESTWSMADRWIVSRFNRTVAECNDALANYRFDQYAKACYDFFWGDFCDWYVEASKPAMKDPNRAEQTAHVLAATLDGSLRLLHPLIPYVTEEIWQKLRAVRAQRELPARIAGSDSPLLIRADWPTVGDFSEAAEHIWPRIQEIVVAIRNVRNLHKVDPKKPVTVSIKSPGDSGRQLLNHRPEIELLATCKLENVAPDLPAPPNATTVSAAGCEIYLQGLVDPAAEQQRNAKRIEELSRQISAMQGRLSNPGYADKAPKHLVDQTRQQLADAEAELSRLRG